MSIKIRLKQSLNEKLVKNHVFFTDQDFKISGFNKLSIFKNFNYINKSIDSNKLNNKFFLSFDINPTQKITLVKIKNNQSSLDIEKIGADFYNYLKSNSLFKVTFYEKNIKNIYPQNQYFFDEFIHGIELKSYEFNKYKTKNENKIYEIDILSKKKSLNLGENKRFRSLIEGTNYTKDLVSEPGNILHPDEYAKRLLQLKKFGLKVKIYNEAKLKKLGMNALLGVGQGSIRGSYLVTLEWDGIKSKKKTISICWERSLF